MDFTSSESNRSVTFSLLRICPDSRLYLWRLKIGFMHSSGHCPKSDATGRRARKSNARRRGVHRKQLGNNAQTDHNSHLAPVGTLTRTRTLLLAALRVWELRHRIRD